MGPGLTGIAAAINACSPPYSGAHSSAPIGGCTGVRPFQIRNRPCGGARVRLGVRPNPAKSAKGRMGRS